MLDKNTDYITVKQAQDMLGIGRMSLYKLLHSGQVAGIKIGPRKWWILQSSLQYYLDIAHSKMKDTSKISNH